MSTTTDNATEQNNAEPSLDELVGTASTSGDDADDARAALALLLRLVDRGSAA